MSGWKGRVYKEWTFLTVISSGQRAAAVTSCFLAVGGRIFRFVRPNVTGAPLYAAPAGLHLNPAAYVLPPAGQWGECTERCDHRAEPVQLRRFDGAHVSLEPRFNLDVKFAATNALNHVTFTSWHTNINSTQFGLPAIGKCDAYSADYPAPEVLKHAIASYNDASWNAVRGSAGRWDRMRSRAAATARTRCPSARTW